MHCSTALRARWHLYMATSLSSVTLIKAFIRGALRMPPTWTPCSETLLYVCLAGIIVTALLTQSYTRTRTASAYHQARAELSQHSSHPCVRSRGYCRLSEA